MSKKTLALIIALFVITVVLVAAAVNTSRNNVPSQNPVANAPTPTPYAHSILTLSPASTQVAPNTASSVNVMIDTGENVVSGVQLELSYDPVMLTDVKVAPGTFFTNPLAIINRTDATIGRVTYALVVSKASLAQKGVGTVATISFTTKYPGKGSGTTELKLLPKTLVSAIGVGPSVLLRSGEGVTITIGPSASTQTHVVYPAGSSAAQPNK